MIFETGLEGFKHRNRLARMGKRIPNDGAREGENYAVESESGGKASTAQTGMLGPKDIFSTVSQS